jgi:hypothetical protein
MVWLKVAEAVVGTSGESWTDDASPGGLAGCLGLDLDLDWLRKPRRILFFWQGDMIMVVTG